MANMDQIFEKIFFFRQLKNSKNYKKNIRMQKKLTTLVKNTILCTPYKSYSFKVKNKIISRQ